MSNRLWSWDGFPPNCEFHPTSVGCPVGMKTVSSGLELVDIYHHSLSTPACHCAHGNTGNDSLSFTRFTKCEVFYL